ncbi:ropporin-1-like protein isoform X2 [Betta splendens]|uniref:Ropporin-1-like protein n=1 Tax=Betta splendens TaxID=158456 RepID=A0A6P7M9S2_BETSP|nr:ropporin-1-like protein isoform X2 [Betta splendens]
MPLPDTMYCAQQINIPPELPDILKNFTKAAIRTQPRDLCQWSAAYFSALSKGERLPVKDSLETNVATQKTDTGLTPGLLKILHKQLSPGQTCSKEELQKKWKGLCLPMDKLEMMLALGCFTSEINWMEFFALGCSDLGANLLGSLKIACEILTEDEDGGAARIPFSTFVELYTFLAKVDGDMTQDYIDNFLSRLQPTVERQHGMIKPLDFIHQEHRDSTPFTSSVASTSVRIL